MSYGYEILDLTELADELDSLRNLTEMEDYELDEDELSQLQELEEVDSDLGGLRVYSDNEPTATSEYGFENYAQQLAEDIGAIDSDATWPLYCIDWERAANDLRMDYSSFEYKGETWLVRSY